MVGWLVGRLFVRLVGVGLQLVAGDWFHRAPMVFPPSFFWADPILYGLLWLDMDGKIFTGYYTGDTFSYLLNLLDRVNRVKLLRVFLIFNSHFTVILKCGG